MEHQIDQLIEVVRLAIEDGRASRAEIEAWLIAAIELEGLALENEISRPSLTAWISPSGALH